MHPGIMIQTIEPSWKRSIHAPGMPWALSLVIACHRSKIATMPYVDEKTNKRSNEWPVAVAWRCLVLTDDRIVELILDDDDRGKSWMTI
jgi:hypothetical protein